MRVLENVEPKNVFGFFEEICGIPHGSGNVKEISDYLVNFAKERDLFYIQDEVNNVIIVKEATPGYENEPAVIIQGHMDMVAVKTETASINMDTDPLQLQVEGDFIFAKETSLGGDDGIAVAYGLAILDSKELKHPRLEMVFTVDEETGMDGAREIDLSMLQGKQLLNIDSEEEGFLLTSCAGGARINTELSFTREEKEGTLITLAVHGLQGGHSGVEIHKERANASHTLARVLYQTYQEHPFYLCHMEGGLKDNAIPLEAKAEIMVDAEIAEVIYDCFTTKMEKIKEELVVKDPHAALTCSVTAEKTQAVLSKEDTLKAISFVMLQPDGVQTNSANIEGLVETSLNLGIMEMTETMLSLNFSVRSSVQSAKEFLLEKVALIATMLGGTYRVFSDYPGWEYKQGSPLRDKMTTAYHEMYGKEMVLQAIHAGLECGLLSQKIEGLDCVSFGPDMQDIHTTDEKLSISSTKRVWEYIIKVLEMK